MEDKPKVLSKEKYNEVIALIDKSVDECVKEIYENPLITTIDKKIGIGFIVGDDDLLRYKYIDRQLEGDLLFAIEINPKNNCFYILIKIWTYEFAGANIAIRQEYKIQEIMSNESPHNIILNEISGMKKRFEALFKSE